MNNQTMNPENKCNAIISLSSHHERLKYVHRAIISILNNNVKPYKIVLTIHKDDTRFIGDELQSLINNHSVELNTVNVDLKPHNKYFYAMTNYRNNPIITIDDDCEYPEDLIESLMRSYHKYPKCISARRVHKVKYKNDGALNLYKYWHREYQNITTPSFDIFATGVGGVLYPPDILKISETNIPEIKKFITVDDMYLYSLERKANIKIVYVPNNQNHPTPINEREVLSIALCLTNEASDTTKNDEAIDELINKHLMLNHNNKMKICYTAIIGNYDSLKEPDVVTDDWKYICFTNQPFHSKVWELRPFPTELMGLNEIKQQRLIKINPKQYLPDYDECIWVDGNITIQCDLNDFCKTYIKNTFCTVKHYQRDCIYDECDEVLKCGKDTKEHTDAIKKKLEVQEYPLHNGLAETNLIYRQNDERVNKICSEWSNQMLINATHRDQLTFNYVLWKLKEQVDYLPSDIVRNGKLFKLSKHSQKKQSVQIFVLCYKKVEYEIPDNSLYTPLQCGANVFKEDLYPTKDNTFNNISIRNPYYAETTGTYWIWKNMCSKYKYIGQTQYRRQLLIDENINFDTLFQKYAVITSQGLLFNKSVYKQFKEHHNINDLECMRNIIVNKFPQYASDFNKYILNGNKLYANSAIILKSEDFSRYCEFLFTCIHEHEKINDIHSIDDAKRYLSKPFKKPNVERQRLLYGFLAERLMTLFILHNFNGRILEIPYWLPEAKPPQPKPKPYKI